MKYLVLLNLIFLQVINAQNKYDYIWKIGYGRSDGIKSSNATILDFNNDNLTIKQDSITTSIYFSNTSICDKNGNLICYSGGYWLEDISSNIVFGSKNLVGLTDSRLLPMFEKEGAIGGIQSTLILPTPELNDQEFIFLHFILIHLILTIQKIYVSLDLH